ncbi:MAG: hypothetical protein M1813_002795 [Trichoglossum hirsutum]|nr:MAG: hypothetical protein M1813_002795 [Trichoglossum hirsutum]
MTINNDEDDVRKASREWKRRDTENGSRQRQKTKYETISRRRSKEFDIAVGLKKISEFAKTGATATRLLSSLRKNHTLTEILTMIQSKLLDLPKNDVILLANSKSLENALSKPFRVPLLHCTTANYPCLESRTDFDIQNLLMHLEKVSLNTRVLVSVYDYSIQDPSERTRTTTVNELLSYFRLDNSNSIELNFLDIENCTGISFCPSQIILQDITTILEARKRLDIGKTRSEWNSKLREEFFLLSRKEAISPIHADSKAKNTWILVLKGQKI